MTQKRQIRLSNDGVVVTVLDSDAEAEVPADTVIQSPWTLTRGVDIVKFIDYDSDEPIMRVTIIRFTKTGSTSVGLSWSHLSGRSIHTTLELATNYCGRKLGDGFSIYQFARLLSQNYQGLEPLDPAPTYDRAPPQPFDPEKYKGIPLPDCMYHYSFRSTPPHLEPGRKKPDRIDIRLTAGQIAQINKGILAQCPDGNTPILSRQDTLVAVLAYCISKADPDSPPVQHISTILMVRLST